MTLRTGLLTLIALLALPTLAAAEVHYYLVETIAAQAPKAEGRAEARALEKIYADMARESGVEAKLVYSTDPDINAFATEVGGDKIVVVQSGLLTMMDGDRDAVAAVLGHELAHHKADHIRAGKRKQEGVRVLGSILGVVVGAKVGRHGGELAGAAAGAAVGVGAGLVALKFNRDQEMEADRLSVGWMIAAGYNPDGMLRLQQKLGELEGHSKAAILSTHPTSAKRYQAAQKQIAKLAPAPDLRARPVAPLVGSEALASAQAEISNARREHLAEALQPKGGGTVDAAALAPVDRVTLDTYARIEHELQDSSGKGRAQLLGRNHLTEAQYHRVEMAYLERIVQNPALAQHYEAAFFRAAQGKYAAYGRDLADSIDQRQELTLQPPYPVDVAARLSAAMEKRQIKDDDAAAKAVAERELLQPYGLSYNDFVICDRWWSRKVHIAHLLGDDQLALAYYRAAAEPGEAQAQTESANVHIGANVHVGDNVRVGGKALAPDRDTASH